MIRPHDPFYDDPCRRTSLRKGSPDLPLVPVASQPFVRVKVWSYSWGNLQARPHLVATYFPSMFTTPYQSFESCYNDFGLISNRGMLFNAAVLRGKWLKIQ